MLDPVLDSDGVMRVGGRIRKANLPPTLKNPVFLPKSSHISSLIISNVHERTHHSGRGITLNELRSCGYWIVSGNATFRQFISKCVTCRHVRASQGEQKMADLPKSRVEPTPPFTYCGVDYFGPWHVQRGRSVMKRYRALFTCIASRAVHIEVADSLETDSFINAVRRFICRRGSVREIRCNRGTNFIGAEAELKKAIEEMDDQEIKAELLKESIDWIKNPASASNFGGVWERQIRSIRNAMNGPIREHGSRLDEDLSRTLLCEAEHTINNRHLTVETLSDPHSAPPLSPSMLRTGKTRLVLPPPGEFKREDLYCRKMWWRTQHMAQEFWSRWCKEYLQQLQARNKRIRPRRNFQVGDVVLLKDTPVKVCIDSGATANTIDYAIYEAICAVKTIPLKPTNVKLRSYGEDNPAPIPLAGSFYGLINTLSGLTDVTRFLVLKARNAGCLLCRETSTRQAMLHIATSTTTEDPPVHGE